MEGLATDFVLGLKSFRLFPGMVGILNFGPVFPAVTVRNIIAQHNCYTTQKQALSSYIEVVETRAVSISRTTGTIIMHK